MPRYGTCYNATGSRCSGRAQPGTLALRSAVRKAYPGIGDLGIYNCRPTRGGGSLSTHGEGRGWDAACNANTQAGLALGNRLAADLVAHHQDLGIQRVIWNRRQWDSRTKAWRKYGGVSPHTDHLHIELCWASARDNPLTESYVRGILGDDEEDWLMALTEAEQKKLLENTEHILNVKQKSRLDYRFDLQDELLREAVENIGVVARRCTEILEELKKQ